MNFRERAISSGSTWTNDLDCQGSKMKNRKTLIGAVVCCGALVLAGMMSGHMHRGAVEAVEEKASASAF